MKVILEFDSDKELFLLTTALHAKEAFLALWKISLLLGQHLNSGELTDDQQKFIEELNLEVQDILDEYKIDWSIMELE